MPPLREIGVGRDNTNFLSPPLCATLGVHRSFLWDNLDGKLFIYFATALEEKYFLVYCVLRGDRNNRSTPGTPPVFDTWGYANV